MQGGGIEKNRKSNRLQRGVRKVCGTKRVLKNRGKANLNDQKGKKKKRDAELTAVQRENRKEKKNKNCRCRIIGLGPDYSKREPGNGEGPKKLEKKKNSLRTDRRRTRGRTGEGSGEKGGRPVMKEKSAATILEKKEKARGPQSKRECLGGGVSTQTTGRQGWGEKIGD